MKKVLLTGGTGLLGKEVIPFLIQEGFEIYSISRKPSINCDGVINIQSDIFNFNEINEIISNIKPQYLLQDRKSVV